MNRREKLVCGIAIAIMVAATVYGVVRTWSIKSLTGAVLRQDTSPENQLPIPNAEIRVSDDLEDGAAKSDSRGYFQVRLRKRIRKGEGLVLHFRHADYQPLDFEAIAGDGLYVVRMPPASNAGALDATRVPISEVRLRYGVKSRTTANVGSVVKVFDVPNTGDVACSSNVPCSPDGKWRAALGSASLDAGDDNEFQDARVSCISGPC